MLIYYYVNSAFATPQNHFICTILRLFLHFEPTFVSIRLKYQAFFKRRLVVFWSDFSGACKKSLHKFSKIIETDG